jgi:thiol:disulfide interchange protein DsbD
MSVAEPGKPFLVGVEFHLDPEWHCYWKNPGDSGTPPEIRWHLPPKWQANELEWPVPAILKVQGGLVNYGYENDVVFLYRLVPPSDATVGPAKLEADASWLVCQDICLPASQQVSLTQTLAANEVPSADFARLSEAEKQLPATSDRMSFKAKREGTSIWLGEGELWGSWAGQFVPLETSIDPSASQTPGAQGLQLKLSPYAPKTLTRLRGLVLAPAGQTWHNGSRAIVIDIPITTGESK